VELQLVATCGKALPLQVLEDMNMLLSKLVRIQLLIEAGKFPYPDKMHLEDLEHLDSLVTEISVAVPDACSTQFYLLK
jgi:hypothetical protein